MIKPVLFAALAFPLLAAPLATHAAVRCVYGPVGYNCERGVPHGPTTTIIRKGAPRYVPGPNSRTVIIKKKVHPDY